MAIYRKGDDLTPLRKKAEAQAAARNATSSKQLRKRGLTKGEDFSSTPNSYDVSRATVSKNGKHLEVEGFDRKNTKKAGATKVKMPISGSTVNKAKQLEKITKQVNKNIVQANSHGVIKGGKLVKGSETMARNLQNAENKRKNKK